MKPHEDACEIIERDDGNFDVTNGPASYFAEFKHNKVKGRMGGQTTMRIRFQRFKTPWFDLSVRFEKGDGRHPQWNGMACDSLP